MTTPRDLLMFGEALASVYDPDPAKANSQEPFVRTVAHLSYYACYNHAMGFAKTRNTKFSGPDRHRQLWDWAATVNVDIKTDATSLRKKRIDADYKLNKALRHDPKDICDDATALLDLIDAEIAKSHP